MIVTFCTLLDSAYLPIAEALIKSLARWHPDTRLHIGIVGLSDEQRYLLETWHPRLSLWDTYCPPAQIPTKKASLILNAIDLYHQPVLYLDADTIVRGSLQTIARWLHQYDLTILHRPDLQTTGPMGTLHAAKFNAGVVGIKNTPWTHYYLSRVEAHLNTCLTHFHEDITLLDQEAFYLAYQRYKHRVRLAPLPAAFNDCHFSPHSTIWHGKGSAKRHLLFRAESLYYIHGWPWGDISRLLQLLRKARPARNLYRQWWHQGGPT